MAMNHAQRFVILLLALFLVAALWYLYRLPEGQVKGLDYKQEKRAEITFLDVGQGDAILIEKGRTQILIDGGDGQDILNRLGERMGWGDRRLELVIVTHPDEDHMGGLVKVLENYEVAGILESGVDCDKDFCEEWDRIVQEKAISVQIAKIGQEISYGDDIKLSVLCPFEDISGREYDNSNQASLVMMAAVAGKKYLLTGDTEAETEEVLLKSDLDLDADVLKVSHHGSKSATSAAFLMAVTPGAAVVSVGKNSYGHPSEATLVRIRNMNIEILRTDEAGNIAF